MLTSRRHLSGTTPPRLAKTVWVLLFCVCIHAPPSVSPSALQSVRLHRKHYCGFVYIDVVRGLNSPDCERGLQWDVVAWSWNDLHRSTESIHMTIRYIHVCIYVLCGGCREQIFSFCPHIFAANSQQGQKMWYWIDFILNQIKIFCLSISYIKWAYMSVHIYCT